MRRIALISTSLALLAGQAHAQTLDTRVAAVRDGTVQFTYPVRPDACDGRRERTWCGRVVIRRAKGQTTSLRLHSVRWSDSTTATTDLGRVPARDAEHFLIGQARALTGRDATDALWGAAIVDSADARPDLRAIIGDGSLAERLRGDAIIALGGDDIDPNDVAFLERLFPTASDALKDRIFLALSHADDPKAQEWLLAVVADSTQSVKVRKQALFWAGQGDVSTPKLVATYGRLSDPELKRHFAFVLSQRHDAASLDELMAIAKQDPDHAVRKQALFWIGQSRDPRAIKFLEELVTQ